MRKPCLRAVMAAATLAIAGSAFAAAMPASAASKPAPATGFAAHATAYQNAVLGDAMAAHPGGVRISASEAKWPDGTIVGAATSPTAASAEPCPGGNNFCAYAGAGYTSNYAWYPGGFGWVPWGECSPSYYPGCDLGIHSWQNHSGDRVWLEQFKGSGNELCISDGTSNQNYTGVDDDDYWILVSSNPNAC